MENIKGRTSGIMDMLHDPDVRPFGDSLGLVQTTDPLLGTSVTKDLYQRPLASLNLRYGLALETRQDKSI